MPWNRLDEDGSPLDRWQTVVDQAIAEAQERGEFDDLPGAGKPLQLEENPFAGDSALGFRVLKNAGMAPPWIEADREMSAASSSLDAVLDRARREFARSHEQESPTTDTRAAPPSRRFRLFPWQSAAPAPVVSRTGGSDLELLRQRWRRVYLDEAARLDERIDRYNQLLPANLRWLERPRLTPERAGKLFDAAWLPGPA